MPTDSESQSSGPQALAPAFWRPQVSPSQPLEIEDDRADNWKIWKQQWENYCIITGLNSQPEDYKCAILLHSIGMDAMRIYNGMKFSEGEDRNKMANIIAKYDQHSLGQTQEFFERFQFHRRDQASVESIDEYLSVLRNMSKTCGFCDFMRDLLTMDRLLLGITNDETREELLSTHDLTINKAIEICRGMEAASHHVKVLKNEEGNKIKDISKKKSGQHIHQQRIKKPPQSDDPEALKRKCLFCCQIHVMKREMCQAWGKTCAACGERNHFKASNKCKQQSVNSLPDYYSDSSESSTETISTVTASEDRVVNSVDPGNQLIFCETEINNKPVRMQIDCGSTVCILPKCYLGLPGGSTYSAWEGSSSDVEQNVVICSWQV